MIIDHFTLLALRRAVETLRALGDKNSSKDDPYGGLFWYDDAEKIENFLSSSRPHDLPPLTDDMLRYAMAAIGTGSPSKAEEYRLFWRFASEAYRTAETTNDIHGRGRDKTPLLVHLGPWSLICGSTAEFWGPFKTVDDAWFHLFGRKSSSYERKVFMDAGWAVGTWDSGAENLGNIVRSGRVDATDPRRLIPEDRVPDGPKVVDDGGPVQVIDPAGPGQEPPPGSPGVLE